MFDAAVVVIDATFVAIFFAFSVCSVHEIVGVRHAMVHDEAITVGQFRNRDARISYACSLDGAGP